MILDISFRTDIIAYYSEWLYNRFKEGFLYQRNPIAPNKISKIILSPDIIDVIAFCSKNYNPFMKYVDEINEKYNCCYHYTITGYSTDLEPNVPDIKSSIKTLIELSNKVGKNKIVWRYDPILITSKYTVDYHIALFQKMTEILSPYINRCIFSFVNLYQKVKDNMHDLKECTFEDKNKILNNFGQIALNNNLYLQTCGHGKLYNDIPGIHISGCQTPDIYEQVFNIKFKNNINIGKLRTGCLCMQTHSIGDYNTCKCGCKYCYATKDYTIALNNYNKHDINSPLLIGQVNNNDIISEMKQYTLLDNKLQSSELF